MGVKPQWCRSRHLLHICLYNFACLVNQSEQKTKLFLAKHTTLDNSALLGTELQKQEVVQMQYISYETLVAGDNNSTVHYLYSAVMSPSDFWWPSLPFPSIRFGFMSLPSVVIETNRVSSYMPSNVLGLGSWSLFASVRLPLLLLICLPHFLFSSSAFSMPALLITFSAYIGRWKSQAVFYFKLSVFPNSVLTMVSWSLKSSFQ